MRLRRSLLAAGAAAALVAGCGEGGETVAIDATPAGLARAATATLDGSTGRFRAAVSFDVAGQAFDMTMEGAFDGAAGRALVTVDMSQVLDQLPTDEVPPGVDLGAPMRMVIDGSTMYICWAGFAELTGGRPCGSVDIGAAGLPTTGAGDPTTLLRTLAGSDDVEEVGPDTVDGVGTTHLRGVVTMRESLEALDPEQADALRQQMAGFGTPVDSMLDTPIPFDVWIDGDGFVRRMKMGFDLGSFAPGSGTMTMDMRLFDFGDDVDIEVPDPSDVADIGWLLGGLTPPAD